MPPLKILVSVVAQVGRSMGCRRNFSSSPGSSNELEEVKRDGKGLVVLFAVRSIPFCVGYGLAGPLIFGDKVAILEEKRQEEWRKIYGESADEIGDVRDMVVPGLGASVWSYLRDNAPGLGASVWSYLSDNAARMWSVRKP